MARIGLNIYVSGYTGNLLIVWKEVVAGNPTPPETGRSSALSFPYSDVYSINDLNPYVHLVELWRSSDGVALDELIKRWEIDASVYNVARFYRYQYQVDRGWNNTNQSTGSEVWADPVDLDTVLADERLDGATKDQLRVHQAGYGDMLDAEYDLHSGGGIELLDGNTFNSGTAWFIEREVIQEATVTVSAASIYKGVQTITSDTDFYTDASTNLYNKLVIVEGAGNVVTVTFPDLATIANNTRVTFNTHGGSHKYLALQFDTGDTVNIYGQAKNLVHIAKGQEISLYFYDGVCYITQHPSNYLLRGHIVAGHQASLHTITGAVIYADEATGELAKADYPGLYAFIESLTGTAVCSLGTGSGQWSESSGGTYPNKRKFGIDTTAFTCRVPHLDGVSPKFYSTPGVYEADQLLAHTHTKTNNITKRGTGGNPNHAVAHPGGDAFGTFTDVTGDVTSGISSGSENRVKAVLLKPFIYL